MRASILTAVIFLTAVNSHGEEVLRCYDGGSYQPYCRVEEDPPCDSTCQALVGVAVVGALTAIGLVWYYSAKQNDAVPTFQLTPAPDLDGATMKLEWRF